MLEKVMKDCLPWVRHHAGAGEEYEKVGAEETKYCEQTATPMSCTPA